MLGDGGGLSKTVISSYFCAFYGLPARFGRSISSDWMKLKCWRDISFRPAPGLLQRKNGSCNRPKCMSLRILSRCLQVCIKNFQHALHLIPQLLIYYNVYSIVHSLVFF